MNVGEKYYYITDINNVIGNMVKYSFGPLDLVLRPRPKWKASSFQWPSTIYYNGLSSLNP